MADDKNSEASLLFNNGTKKVSVIKSSDNSDQNDDITLRKVFRKNLANKPCRISIGDPNKPKTQFTRKTITLTHVPKRPPLDIEFKNLTYTVNQDSKKGPKEILKCLDGKFKCGELSAIMGPSGAGKSSLMNILAGYRITNVSGSVLINGKERNYRKFRKMACYIMQDDCLTPLLTVKEALNISVRLKLGNAISKKVKNAVIEDVIEALNLSECVDTRTVFLSGGQKKRLSIALELVNNPPVMFFDEPTSGLDSSSCFQCLCLLKSLALGGRTIICTIHQPSARLFEMFDHLYVLVEGYCMYKGEIGGLVPFLSSMDLHCPAYHNPADYLMEVACGDHGDVIGELVDAVNAGECENYSRANHVIDDISKPLIDDLDIDRSNDQKPEDTESKNSSPATQSDQSTCRSSLLESNENMAITTFPTSGIQQFLILLKRTFVSTLRDQHLTRFRLFAHVAVGILLGTLYFQIGNDASKVQSNAGCVFFMVFFTMFSSMMPVILTFPMERPVFIKEHLNYWYSVKSYYFAKTCSDIPFQIVMTVCYIAVVYFMSGQPAEPLRFFMFLWINILTALNSQSIGLIVGTLLDVEAGTFCGPISTIPLLLFSGYFVRLGDIPSFLKWLTHVSYMKYSFEGSMVAIYGLDREKMVCDAIYCHFKYPSKFLEQLSVTGDLQTYLIDVAVLTAIFFILRVTLYILFRRKILANR